MMIVVIIVYRWRGRERDAWKFTPESNDVYMCVAVMWIDKMCLVAFVSFVFHIHEWANSNEISPSSWCGMTMSGDENSLTHIERRPDIISLFTASTMDFLTLLSDISLICAEKREIVFSWENISRREGNECNRYDSGGDLGLLNSSLLISKFTCIYCDDFFFLIHISPIRHIGCDLSSHRRLPSNKGDSELWKIYCLLTISGFLVVVIFHIFFFLSSIFQFSISQKADSARISKPKKEKLKMEKKRKYRGTCENPPNYSQQLSVKYFHCWIFRMPKLFLLSSFNIQLSSRLKTHFRPSIHTYFSARPLNNNKVETSPRTSDAWATFIHSLRYMCSRKRKRAHNRMVKNLHANGDSKRDSKEILRWKLTFFDKFTLEELSCCCCCAKGISRMGKRKKAFMSQTHSR